ncbi:hypothetical protein B0H63DRAFT_414354 [Podospora didyma]|uniref:Metal homeostatis protein BSD2 n=1 Tax=Podospora didyma TaxID=330526 RepID=A0AAE0NPK8_9PEZI|nr:hypothetical protein B0H63DRAFT_414354 [Podospora didyma]
MSGGYERVNARDEDEPETPTGPLPRNTYPIPSSPPPSFHSRDSSVLSRERDQVVDPALADAFDVDGDDSDDDADDTQRLVRSTTPSVRSGHNGQASTTAPRPAHHAQPQTTATPAAGSAPNPLRVYGSGIQSDGVFSNLAARPERGAVEEKEEMPPTYEQAAADQAPPYWEVAIMAPNSLSDCENVYIDGMPVGSFFSFVWNAMISMSFQLVGFLLTYLLHSTHAAKNGSRAGLGITLIQYGFYMKGPKDNSNSGAGGMVSPQMAGDDGYAPPPDPNAHDFDPNAVDHNGGGGGGGVGDLASSDWVAYILMIVGWFILIRAVSDYLKAKRHLQLVLQSPDRGLGVPIIAEGERSETVV